MATKEKRGIKLENTIYSSEKPAQCDAQVEKCTDCPYDSCLFDFGNMRMLKRKERGVYIKHGKA